MLVNGSRGIVTKIEDKKVFVKFLDETELCIEPLILEIEEKGKIVAKRTQYPIMLCWSMTVHKAQGQTCDYLEMDLKDVFAEGQAYVALSRGVSLDNMIVRNMSKRCVKTNDNVLNFYNKLERGNKKRKEIDI
jgi:ATP-dependent exoDNAse (exonuclease V) alpha subunit